MNQRATLKQVQEARFDIERKALVAAQKNPTIVGLIRRLYGEARAASAASKADPYLTGRADVLEELLIKMEKAAEITAGK